VVESTSTTKMDAMKNRIISDATLVNIREFCRLNHIRRFSFFGSVLTDEFGPDSDIDILVEFEDGHVPGLFRLAGMELELSRILGGRSVDMNTPNCLSPYFREEVRSTAEVAYAK